MTYVINRQPPSGGCVLKQRQQEQGLPHFGAAAFGRLCVETKLSNKENDDVIKQPPSGGCVLKLLIHHYLSEAK